jgi:hypothetical protein
LLKTYPALLLLPLLLRRRFSAIALTCVVYGVIALAAAIVLPHSVWASWLHEVVPSGRYGTDSIFAEPGNQNINAFVNRLFLPNPFCDAMLNNATLAKPIATVLALLVFGITIITAFYYHRRGDTEDGGQTEIACFLLAIFLVAPLSWNNHLVLVLPAAVLALSLVLAGKLRWPLAAMIGGALLILAKGINFAHPAISKGWWTLLISIKFYAVLALWAYFIARLARSGGTEAGFVKRRADLPHNA